MELEQILKIISSLEDKEEITEEPISAITPEGLQQAFSQAAKKKAAPKRLNKTERLIALQRKWHLIYPNDGMPEDLEMLETIIPSVLDKKETSAFLRGSLEEAKVTFLETLNTSWTKRGLYKKAIAEGVPNALKAFEPKTRGELEEVIKFLSD